MKRLRTVDWGVHHILPRIKNVGLNGYPIISPQDNFEQFKDHLAKRFKRSYRDDLTIHEVNPYVVLEIPSRDLQDCTAVYRRSYTKHYALIKHDEHQTAYTHNPKKKPVISMLRIYDPCKKAANKIDPQYRSFLPGQLCKIEMRFFPRKLKLSNLDTVEFPSFYQPTRWKFLRVSFPPSGSPDTVIQRYQLFMQSFNFHRHSTGHAITPILSKDSDGNFRRDYGSFIKEDQRIKSALLEADAHVKALWQAWISK